MNLRSSYLFCLSCLVFEENLAARRQWTRSFWEGSNKDKMSIFGTPKSFCHRLWSPSSFNTATTNTLLPPLALALPGPGRRKSCPMDSLNHSAGLRLPAVSWSTDGPSWHQTHTDKCQLSKCQNLFLILGTPVVQQYFIYGLRFPPGTARPWQK